ncbi:MAG: hypothetical protein Q8L47_04375 [bacterium]|nr:hypothetical protein [bacterium]
MSKSLGQFESLEHGSAGEINRPEKDYRKKLFGQLITDAESELSKLGFPEETWQIKIELIKAMVLEGDIESAEREAKTIPLNEEYIEYVSNAFLSIVKGLAKENPKKALELMPNILDENQYSEALFEVLKAISDKWELEEIQKLADQIIEIPCRYYQIEARLVVTEVLAAKGQIEAARGKAQQEPGPTNQLRAYLLIYKSSQASEDIEAARALATKCDYQPWEEWLQIAKTTRDPNDVTTARKEIASINDIVTKGKQTTHFKERALIKLAKITGKTEDIQTAREATIAADRQSLLMEFARFTRSDADIDLLRKSGKNPSEHFDALASVAEITKQESDFRAAYEAAKELRTIPKVALGEYLRSNAFAELAQILQGETLRR